MQDVKIQNKKLQVTKLQVTKTQDMKLKPTKTADDSQLWCLKWWRLMPKMLLCYVVTISYH